MLRLAIYIPLLVLVKTDDLLGVNYSFDVDFYMNFNTKKCDSESTWRLVEYRTLGVEAPFADSKTAIEALGGSCASSFPIVFVGGTLNVNVYSDVISEVSKLSIEVFDEDDVRIIRYVYQRSSEAFRQGWTTVSLQIDKHVRGYIHLRGTTLKNEIILIDSFHYTPNVTITDGNNRAKRSVGSEDDDEAEIIFNYKWNNDERLESSGDNENESEIPPTDNPIIEEPEESNTFWNPFTITIVSVGAFVVLGVFVVGAYQYGKVRATSNPPVRFDDVEPPRTITIPRATSTFNRGNPSRYYDF